MQGSVTPPKWFNIVASIAIIWNLLGVIAFVMGPALNDNTLVALSEAERDLYLATPLWATIAFGVAVFAGALGCIALLAKKSIAKPILTLSLIAVIVQMFHAYFISDSWEVFGPGGAIMPLMVIIIAIYLVMLSVKALKKGWIR
jgi:hypothetical protein